jgi:predicted dinucleotide-binding enzyme
MNFGIFGTGKVGQTIGSRLVELGNPVRMGSRTNDNPSARAWTKINGKLATQGTFEDAAQFGEVLFNCTSGMGSLSALQFAKSVNLNNKVLIDVANPLDFSRGTPPSLTVCNTDSLAEQIQRAHPLLNVVKALNTMNCEVMVHPDLVPGNHDVFICGNNANAKAITTVILMDSFGWNSVVDLGDITSARGLEMVVPFWLSVRNKLGTDMFNFKVIK